MPKLSTAAKPLMFWRLMERTAGVGAPRRGGSRDSQGVSLHYTTVDGAGVNQLHKQLLHKPKAIAVMSP